ncbi:MAG: T9SS type A sorting domain-containing protein [candidate division Zixibacteria bacterium]|nr:T9SS type A sorting domain-containing protein [candidate division Zixibacteria bacterium]
MRFLFTAMIFTCLLAPKLLAWGNPTHFMLGEEVRMRESLPDACYTDRFVMSNNSPDIFSLFGPGFAHSDYRFAEILLELAGDDLDKQAFAFGYYSHISCDAIAHNEYLPPPGIEHAVRELAISSIVYFDNPILRDAGDRIAFGYYPQMIRDASEIFVQRYNEGRVIEEEEMVEMARFLAYAIVAQHVVIRNVLFLYWASHAEPRSKWIDFYNRSIDSACVSIVNAAMNPHAEIHVGHTHSISKELSLAHLGKKLCNILGVELQESKQGEYVSFEANLANGSIGENDALREILSSNDLDANLRWLSNLYDKISDMDTQIPSPGISLLPSHPNPFNASTEVTIECDILVDRIDVSVINLAGQHVARLFSGSFSVGMHTIDWNGSDDSGRDVSSGVYFVTVRTDNITLSQKLLLVK